MAAAEQLDIEPRDAPRRLWLFWADTAHVELLKAEVQGRRIFAEAEVLGMRGGE